MAQDGTSWRSLNAPFDEDGFALVKRDIETLFLKTVPSVSDGVSAPPISYQAGLPSTNYNFGAGSGGSAFTGSINLASQVSGILPVANGGTGVGTLTGYVKGNGTSVFTASATVPWTDISGVPTTLAGYGITDAVPATRTVSTTAPLSGGGALSGNLTLALGTVPIANGGTNTTSASAGTIPQASSGTASTWTAAPTLGVAGTTLGSMTLESPTVAAGSRMRVVVSGTELSIYYGSTATTELVLRLQESDFASIAASIKGTTNCIQARVIAECDSSGNAKSRVYLCSAQY